MIRPPVLNKQDFATRYARGEFGNASPTWDDPEVFLNKGWLWAFSQPLRNPMFHLRNRVAAGETHYNLSMVTAYEWWRQMPKPQDWYCSAMCPTEKTLLQGEVIQGNYGFDRIGGEGLDLFYTTVAKPMREALAERPERLSGIGASCLLRSYLCPNSWEWLNELLSLYPGHVVEFTTLSTCWGTLPGFNTLFWEVRSY